MNETAIDSLDNRESRYTVQDEQVLTVMLLRNSNGELLPATVANLSLGGAKFVVSQPLSFTELVRVSLALPDSDVCFDVPARICWARPVGDGTFSVGCAFSERLTPEVLNSLSELGYLERRAHGRVLVNFSALSKWELSDTNSTVQVLDYSTGGFVMVSRQRAQADQQLMLEISTEHGVFTLSARVVWQTRMEESYRIGCSFVGKKDAETMARAARAIHGDDETTVLPVAKATRKKFSAAALFAIVLTLLTSSLFPWFRTQSRQRQQSSTVPVSVVIASNASTQPKSQPAVASEVAVDPIQPELELNVSPTAMLPIEVHATDSAASNSADLLAVDPVLKTEEPLGNKDLPLSDGADQRVRDCVRRSNSGDFRAALADLGVVIKESPRDPAYRYVIAAIASNAGFHGFAQVQFDLGWKLEQRYPSFSAIRLVDSLTSEQNEWLTRQRSLKLKAVHKSHAASR